MSRRTEEPTGEEFPDHPLFPLEPGQKQAREIAFIQVMRWEGGSQKWHPKPFQSGDLTSLEQIQDLWGGGKYELVARGRSPRDPALPYGISARRTYELPGKPKPFTDDPTLDEMRRAGMHDPPSTAPAPPSSSGGHAPAAMGETLLLGIMQMQTQQSQQFMALMTQMMTSGKSDAVEAAKLQAEQQRQFTQLMMTTASQQQQSMLGMMTAVLQNRGGGGGADEITKFARVFKDLGLGVAPAKVGEEDKPANESIGAILENAADIVQGVVALKGGGGVIPTANGQPPPPAPPGSAAAAVLGQGEGLGR